MFASAAERLFLRHTSQPFTTVIPNVCTSHFLRAGATLPSPCHIPVERTPPWDQLSMCLRNCTFWSKSALRIGHGWMVLAVLKMTVSKPRRFYNADPGSSSPSRPLGRGGVRACVLRPASFPSCRVHSFLHSYWCHNTSFWKCTRLKWIFLCFQLLSSVSPKNPKPQIPPNWRAACLGTTHFCLYMPKTIT